MRGGEERVKGAFVDLYDRAGRRLLVFLARRMHDLDAAAEVWSECWAIAFKTWPRCRAESQGEAEAWLWGIARNQLAAYYRSGAIERRALERLGWTMPPVEGLEDEEFARVADLDALRCVLGDALSALPVKRRRAVQLRIVDELSYEEVAARMGCSEQSARAHVSRGLRRLAAALDQHEQLTLERTAR
jgi:RNA polymerase sigma-70 factor (ECF subfamily)